MTNAKRVYWLNREKIKNARRARYHSLKRRGLCANCGKVEPKKNASRCPKCLLKNRKYNLDRTNVPCPCGRTKTTRDTNRRCSTCRGGSFMMRLNSRFEVCPCGQERHTLERTCAFCQTVLGSRGRVRGSIVVGILRDHPNCSIYDLAINSGVSTRGVLRVISKLRARGLIREQVYDGEQAKRYALKGVSNV